MSTNEARRQTYEGPFSTLYLSLVFLKEMGREVWRANKEWRQIMKELGRIGMSTHDYMGLDFLNPAAVQPSFSDEELDIWRSGPAT